MQAYGYDVTKGQKFRFAGVTYTALSEPSGDFNTQIDVAREGYPDSVVFIRSDQKVLLLDEDGKATYPAGTKITAIDDFDRSTKVTFTCPEHGGQWASKDPWVSTWFGESERCSCPIYNLVTVTEYRS